MSNFVGLLVTFEEENSIYTLLILLKKKLKEKIKFFR